MLSKAYQFPLSNTLNLSIMRFLILLFFMLFLQFLSAQDKYWIEIGPMKGHYTDTTENQWLLLNKKNLKNNFISLEDYLSTLRKDISIKNTVLTVEELLGERMIGRIAIQKTNSTNYKETLTFLTGSCAFQYPSILNMGGKRKRLNKIFSVMSKENSDFMVWTGDNVYYLFGQWNSYKKMVNENLKTRQRKPIKAFLESCPQYATWDDHDFGPNNSDGSFKNKEMALDVFKKFWSNPYYGKHEKDGVYCHFSQNDCDFFILDSRYHCNKDKDNRKLLGDNQLKWLKEQLLASKGKFKFIFNGTQFLTNDIFGESWMKYPDEHKDFMNFIDENKIPGLIFISGDRHYSELMKLDRENNYPLYEFTCSPLTSFMDASYDKNNPIRVKNTAIKDQNFGKIKVYQKENDWICSIEEFDTEGKLIWKQEIKRSELKQ